jgi:hypothetical protein
MAMAVGDALAVLSKYRLGSDDFILTLSRHAYHGAKSSFQGYMSASFASFALLQPGSLRCLDQLVPLPIEQRMD